jgi:hypothetical protein
MNIQTRDGFKCGLDVLREFLADGSKHFLEMIEISDLISSVSLQQGKNFLELLLYFL